MRILWFSNIVFPEAIRLLTGEGELKSSGGWMVAAAKGLINEPDIKLAIATATSRVNEIKCLEGNGVVYYLFPPKGNVNDYMPFCKKIHDEYNPDVTHIYGTEYPYGLAYINACGAENVVISVQGLISVIADFYNYGLSKSDIYKSMTLRDFFRGNLLNRQKALKKKGNIEIAALQKAMHVIGRTSWDKAHVWAINPDAKYHFCNETLREEFYTGCWSYQDCTPYTIFISQATYPVKGLHQLFKAMPLILRQYPETQIRIAGGYLPKGIIQKIIKGTGYSRYLSQLAKKLSIKDHIIYLGSLNGEQMKSEYLKANMFVCPSTIENSPNSLGEAQILGVPCLSSYVGGTMDMIPNKDCGELYRFEDVEMLAYKICEIFRTSKDFNNDVMRNVASQRHHSKTNAQKLVSIYRNIIE